MTAERLAEIKKSMNDHGSTGFEVELLAEVERLREENLSLNQDLTELTEEAHDLRQRFC